jgi:hypothetical protein
MASGYYPPHPAAPMPTDYYHAQPQPPPPPPPPPPPAPMQPPAPTGMFTRNLIGSLSASAFRLTDPDNKIGVWFILQDLSVRTEGHFRCVPQLYQLSPAISSLVVCPSLVFDYPSLHPTKPRPSSWSYETYNLACVKSSYFLFSFRLSLSLTPSDGENGGEGFSVAVDAG